MDADEPRVRRRGFFLHSTDVTEPDAGEHENPEGFPVRVRTEPLPSTQTLHRRPHRLAPKRRTDEGASRDQIWERDWQPSTGTLAPLIQLERGRSEKRDHRPDFLGAAEPPERQFPRHEVGDPLQDRPAAGDPTIHPETESIPAPRC